MRGADTRHCWPRVNTGHRDRVMWDGGGLGSLLASVAAIDICSYEWTEIDIACLFIYFAICMWWGGGIQYLATHYNCNSHEMQINLGHCSKMRFS